MPQERQGSESRLTLRDLADAAHASLEASRARIDDLNVYPVPDGDTGTNMLLTARAVRDALEAAGEVPTDEAARVAVRAALMGARGNSGVILSQIVRGAAEGLEGVGEIDGAALAKALRDGSEAAYASVREPQEGTILTVARALAGGAEAVTESDPAEAIRAALEAGEEALARTPDQLPILRQAGVVDAGGAGLVEIVRGVAAVLRGEALPEAAATGAGALPTEAIHHELSRYRYCTSLFVEGDGVEPRRIETELGEYGDSLLVVGSPGAVKLHVHTDDPGRVLTLATSLGLVEEIDIKNMHVQTIERKSRLVGRGPAATDVVAVAAGEGNARLFRSMGVDAVVAGGQSMNPSAQEIAEAVGRLAAPEAIVLPNNKNVVAAARQAAELAGKPVRVVPTESMQAGLAAMVAYRADASAEQNATAMEEAVRGVRTGAITRASRTTMLGPLAVEEGNFLGLVEGEPVAAGAALEPVARDVLERLVDGSPDVLTILLGADAPPFDTLREELEAAHPELEIEVHEGGQPHYPLLISAE
jgi:DAK2 domain fusion protein YloV